MTWMFRTAVAAAVLVAALTAPAAAQGADHRGRRAASPGQRLPGRARREPAAQSGLRTRHTTPDRAGRAGRRGDLPAGEAAQGAHARAQRVHRRRVAHRGRAHPRPQRRQRVRDAGPGAGSGSGAAAGPGSRPPGSHGDEPGDSSRHRARRPLVERPQLGNGEGRGPLRGDHAGGPGDRRPHAGAGWRRHARRGQRRRAGDAHQPHREDDGELRPDHVRRPHLSDARHRDRRRSKAKASRAKWAASAPVPASVRSSAASWAGSRARWRAS